MTEQVSLKLCLLTSITEETGEEVENEVLISNPKSNCTPGQIRRGDKQNHVLLFRSRKTKAKKDN
jgi:hypothetical protein